MKKRFVQPLEFFVDECVSSDLARVLTIVFDGQCAFEAHNKAFQQGESDLNIIDALKHRAEKPVFFTADARILSNPATMNALRCAGLHYVVLADGLVTSPLPLQAIATIKAWEKLCHEIAGQRSPSIFRITQRGEVQVRNSNGSWLCPKKHEQNQGKDRTA